MFESWKLRRLQKEIRKKQEEENKDKIIHIKHGHLIGEAEKFVKEQEIMIRKRIGNEMFYKMLEEVDLNGKRLPRDNKDKRGGSTRIDTEGFSTTVPDSPELNLYEIRGWPKKDI